MRRGGLGKGLGALIPPEGSAAAGEGSFLEDIPLGAIVANPHQPRAHFDEEALGDLAASIRELGVLQPVLLRPPIAGVYQLIAGERRWRAAKRAGLTSITAIVRDTDDLGSVEQALVENLHRQDLTPLEEAAAFHQLIDDFGLTHEKVAARVGKSRSAISNTLRLLSLPPGIQQLLADGRLSAGHARALLGTPDRAFQEQLGRRAAFEGMSVRAVEDIVRAHHATAGRGDQDVPDSPPPATTRVTQSRLRPPGLLELEALLADHLSTRVAVTMGAGTGRIIVDFADLEDLERIYRRMAESPANP